jgi:dipeptidyl aminopeptidase/acylaminoacyl peptidase
MVSNGYIVFLIDIKFAPGKTGQSALESALGATNYLSANEWIDSVHVGINGHSFGGFETDYIISHTNRFSAALSASGASNLISNYNSIWGISNASGLGFSKQQLYEKGYYNMTGSLWESQNEYLANSAILYADRINTPLLLMNNKNDPAVAFSQGLELFIALRRLKKTVWLLEYDGQGHNINDFDMAVDYCIRQKQFFDHYLKGSPMPRWMSTGIPFELKGIDDGIGF